jgi:hypothetical protein
MNNMQTIMLTDTEAASFLEWQRNKALFDLLVETGVFSVKNGSVELHFDSLSRLKSIDAHVKLFRRQEAISTHTVIVKG